MGRDVLGGITIDEDYSNVSVYHILKGYIRCGSYKRK